MRPTQSTEREVLLRQVIDIYLSHRAEGEEVAATQLLQQHPDLLPELEVELKKLELIDRARDRAACDISKTSTEGTAEHRETVLLLCCPHCQVRFEMAVDSSLEGVHCSTCGKRFHLASPNTSGRPLERMGRFELLQRLGSGAFGVVWRARDSKLGREVAVKIPLRGRLEPLEVEDFIREARLAARLKHPHIVTVHEVGRDGDCVYIVSDFIDGQQLDEWVVRHALTFQDMARLVAQIALALDHAHQREVVHRDLKPANIMIDRESQPHLTDFGLAKQTSSEITITMDGGLLGTIAYMSPEQAVGQAGRCDARSDVYSLGVVLFELLTGALPFCGNMSVLPYKIVHDEPPSPRRFNRHVTRDLETICLKCLQKKPEVRYQSAAGLAADLQRWLDGIPILARPVGPIERIWRWSRRHPMAAGFATALMTSLLLMATALIVLIPSWQARLSSNKRDIRHQSETLLGDIGLLKQVVAAAESTATEEGIADELRATIQRDQPPPNDAMQRCLDKMHATNKADHTDLPIDVMNWFLLDGNGVLRASSDESHGERVLGANFSRRDYFKEAMPVAAFVGSPYPSENDGHYKVPVSARVVDGDEVLGVIVASVTTPGTRGLDDQQNFLHGLYLLAGIFFAPLAIFFAAAACYWLWARRYCSHAAFHNS